jgi:PEP-CTERM motif
MPCLDTCFPPFTGAPIPFTLGVPFQINVNAFVSTRFSNPGSAGIMFQFSLFESVISVPNFPPQPGAAVTVFQGTATPEPVTWALVGLGLFGIVRSRATRRFLTADSGSTWRLVGGRMASALLDAGTASLRVGEPPTPSVRQD